MNIDITFKEVCKLIKNDETNEPELIKAVDNLLGLTMICSPIFLGPASAAFLPFLGVKDELVKIGKNIFKKFSQKKGTDYLERQERMQMAYGLLIFTSFFEALDKKIPKNLREEIKKIPEGQEFFNKRRNQ